ncbi:MAG: SDR family oxidoreductase [Acidimicrobiales bacterium]
MSGEEVYREVADETCLKYLPAADEIAGSVLFFASSLSSCVTGQSLDVNAGHWIG